MDEAVYQRLYEVEGIHWWFVGKRRIIRCLMERYVRRAAGKVVRVADVGCGCGRSLEELPRGFEGVGADASPLAVDFCRQRGVEAHYGRLPDEIGLAEASFDVVVMADVIEHIEEDRRAVEAAAGLLAPGGVMIVTVPAIPALWTTWDERHGHVRRYTKGAFARALAVDSLDEEMVSYYNMLLLAPAMAVRLWRRLARRDGLDDMTVPRAWINRLLTGIFAAERHLVGRVPLPLGLSLVAVLRKKRVD